MEAVSEIMEYLIFSRWQDTEKRGDCQDEIG